MNLVEKPITRCKAANKDNVLRSGKCHYDDAEYAPKQKTDGNRFMSGFSLIQYCFNNAIHGRFKERSNIRPG